MYNFRTDLANERRDIYKKGKSNRKNEIEGIESEIEKVNETITIERVKITNNQGEKAIGKPIGNYITIDEKKKLRIAQQEEIEKTADVLQKRTKKNNRYSCRQRRISTSSGTRKYICNSRQFRTKKK